MAAANLACFPDDALRVCKLSGAEAAVQNSRLLTLRECSEILKQCIRDTQSARGTYALYRGLELAARILLVACDAAVMVLENKVGPAGMVVEKAYSGGKLVVDAFAGSIDAKQGVTMLLENQATIASLAAEGMGKSKAAKAIDTTKNLVSLAITLWDQVTGAASGAGGDSGIESALRTVQHQLARVQQQIVQLEKELENC